MQRELFEQRLNELLDRRQTPEDDEQFHDEASLSDEQREILLAQGLLLDGLAASDIPSLDDDFAARVVSQARAEQAVVPSRNERGGNFGGKPLLGFLAVCAALLLLAAIPLWSWMNRPAVDVASPDVTDSNAIAGADAAQSPVEDLSQPPESAVADDGFIGNGVIGKDDPLLVDPDHPASEEQIAQRYQEMYRMITEFSSQPSNVVEQDLLAMRPQWVDEMALGLKPVATSVGGAINVLRRNLPPSEKSERSDKPQARAIDGDGVLFS